MPYTIVANGIDVLFCFCVYSIAYSLPLEMDCAYLLPVFGAVCGWMTGAFIEQCWVHLFRDDDDDEADDAKQPTRMKKKA